MHLRASARANGSVLETLGGFEEKVASLKGSINRCIPQSSRRFWEVHHNVGSKSSKAIIDEGPTHVKLEQASKSKHHVPREA